MLDHIPRACASSRGKSYIPESEQSAKDALKRCHVIACSKTGDINNVEDFAMEAWIKQHQASDQFENRNGASAPTYLYRVVRNSITDGRRRESRRASKVRTGLDFDDTDFERDMQSTADAFFTPDQYAEYADTLSALSAVAEHLPQRQKMLLERHYLGADSIKALAKEFQCTVQSLYQARDALLQKLQFAGVLAPQ